MVVDLLGRVGGDPEATALEGPRRSWSYAELAREVDEYADLLRSSGVEPGRVVPLVVEADDVGVLTLLAHWRLGATPAPLHPRLTDREREAAMVALAGAESDAQAILWTSGTAGRPRGVAISYDALLASAHGAADRLALTADDVWLASLSPAHIGGLALLTRALLFGSRLVVYGAFDTAAADALLGDITHLSLVPTQLARLLELRRDARPPDSLRCALVGGAHAPAELVDRALGAGWPVALTYGLTEATSQVATAPPELTRRKPGTVGRPLRGVEVRVEDGGEILVRGATLATGYVPSGQSVADSDGWHHTGDLGRFDGDGHLWVTGRRADRIVTGGVTVHASEVEEVLRSHPDVADAGVVGLADEEWGERVAAWIVPAGDGPDLDELNAFLRERLGGPKLPRLVHVAPDLPRNPNGKVDRAEVRRVLSA